MSFRVHSVGLHSGSLKHPEWALGKAYKGVRPLGPDLGLGAVGQGRSSTCVMLALSRGTSRISGLPFRTTGNFETPPVRWAVPGSTVSMQSPSLTRVVLPFGVNAEGSTHSFGLLSKQREALSGLAKPTPSHLPHPKTSH